MKTQKEYCPLLPVGEGLGMRANTPVEKELRMSKKEPLEISKIAGANRQIPRELLAKARELRKKQTPAEQILWQCLRGRRLFDTKFRRQHNIGQYIVDFYCYNAKLVIEVDGKIHDLPRQKERDLDRENWLKSHGLTVIRFTNEEVFDNLEMVLNKIVDYALPLTSTTFENTTSPPAPLSWSAFPSW